jgi:polysaccharide deacetylase family protein (PEP-CTERM system associated)
VTTLNKKPNPFTFTIDWEDFGQLYYKYFFGDTLAPSPKTIDRQTNIILDLLNETNVKATFFVLGILAKHRPDLVRKIVDEGHEIALHGMNHDAMFKLTTKQAKADILYSKKLISDISGTELLGYRAPFFSIIEKNLYILEYLAELGFQYDSSIFPIKMSRYGIENFSHENKKYKLPNGGEIVELPLTTFKYANKHWPISGGGYIRAMPSLLLRSIFNSIKTKDTMIYMHPYEFDNEKLDIASNFSPTQRNQYKYKIKTQNFRWNLFQPTVVKKIKFILQHNSFSTCIEKSNYVKNNSLSSTILE